jgi:type VI protein secretion system component VasK
MFDDLAPAQSILIAWIAGSLLILILSILIQWLIIRSATLSALRKHAAEERELARAPRGTPPRDL